MIEERDTRRRGIIEVFVDRLFTDPGMSETGRLVRILTTFTTFETFDALAQPPGRWPRQRPRSSSWPKLRSGCALPDDCQGRLGAPLGDLSPRPRRPRPLRD